MVLRCLLWETCFFHLWGSLTLYFVIFSECLRGVFFSCLHDNTFIRFGNKFYQHIVVTLMGKNFTPCTSLTPIADMFLFYYEWDYMLSISHENQANIIEVFNSTSWYLDDLILMMNTLNWTNVCCNLSKRATLKYSWLSLSRTRLSRSENLVPA